MSDDHYSERKQTNVPALYFCIAFVVVLFGFVGYTFVNGSVYRIVNGYDDCGNICGMQNDKNTLNFCGSNDKRTDNLVLLNITQNVHNPNITDIHSRCVKRCEDFPGYTRIINRCILVNGNQSEPTDADFASFLSGVAADLANSWFPILMSSIVALVFSYVLLILFRYAIKYVIWVIYIGIIVAFALGSIAFLVVYFSVEKGKPAGGFLIFSGVLAIFAIVLGLVLFFFRKRIRLVIQVFKEASKALADIPMLIVEPSLTFIAIGFTCVSFLYFAIVIESSGNLEVQNDSKGKFLKAEYVKNAAMSVAHYVNLVAFIWFTSFILGCQHFVIASAVSQWFFTRSKDKLDSPISRGFSLLLRFHLGSVCLGSILITIVKILRMLVENVKKSAGDSNNAAAKFIACCCDFIMEQLEALLQYLVRNAYIIVAKDGTPLIESGRKAFNLLLKNLVDVIALNQFGDFVLILGRLFVVLIAGFVSYELIAKNEGINYAFVPIMLSVIFAFLIIHCFMTVYEMTLDTIFICFCEDCEQNDGTTRPYYMSRDMMDVMMELKQEAGGSFNFGGENVEAGSRPMIPSNWKFANDAHY